MDYNADISAKLDTLPIDKVYAINPERPDLEAFVGAIKDRIDRKGDFVFSGDYTSFKRVKTFSDEVAEMGGNGKIDWMKMVNAIHDTIKRQLEKEYPTQRRY